MSVYRFVKGKVLLDLLNLKLWDYFYQDGVFEGDGSAGITFNLKRVGFYTANILGGNGAYLFSKLETNKRFFSTIEEINQPRVLSIPSPCVSIYDFSSNEHIKFKSC
ncbi:MAG: hypothetical protein QXX12_06205, partial [Nanopusillaceae archaeon]